MIYIEFIVFFLQIYLDKIGKGGNHYFPSITKNLMNL
jgi:hypothetical protein